MIELGSQTARDELRSRGSTRGQRARVRRRHPNHSLVKIHRSYTVKEVARLLGVHTNTVHQWIKVGLQIIENTYPKLIQGQDLRRFLQVRRDRKKCPCKAGQMYCFRCRASKALAGGMLDYIFEACFTNCGISRCGPKLCPHNEIQWNSSTLRAQQREARNHTA